MKNKCKFLAVFVIMMLMLQGLYAQYQGQMDINPADVNFEQIDGWDVITIPSCNMETDVGKPYLAEINLYFAIPEDKTVTGVEFSEIQQQELSGTYNIMPTQPAQIPGEPKPDFVEPDSTIYNINEIYPNVDYTLTFGFMSGVHILGLQYSPLKYNPVTKKVFLTTHLKYSFIYADEDNNPVKPRRMLNASYIKMKKEIKEYVENPADVDLYLTLEKTDDFSGSVFAPDEFPNFSGQAVEYVIITNEILKNGFQEIADWKTKKGIPAVVRTVEWIYNYYTGVDKAEKIRNFIIDAYQNWGTVYFMLGGDSEQVPVRYVWMSNWERYDLMNIIPNGEFIAADMYYACLDGNWNADGDANFGEADWDRHNDGMFENTNNPDANLDDVDRLPEVYIGRMPVEDYLNKFGAPIELNRYKTKFFEYIKTSQGNENNILLFSQDSDHIGHEAMENYIVPQFPTNINITKLYEDDGYTNTDVLNAFNGGDNIKKHIICGYGHAGPTSFTACSGSLYRSDMDNLINNDRSEILYLNQCKTMMWDKNTVTEHFLNSINGGVSVIGYSTLGWTTGVKNFLKPFIHNIYNDDYHIGVAFKKIKKFFFNDSYKDCYLRMDFFSLSLASDPEMPVWTDSPDSQNPLIVSVPVNVYTGEQTIPITINNLISDVNAVVCIYKNEELYAIDTVTGTGNTIIANLECTPDTPGDIFVTVTAKNYLPVEKNIPVTINPETHLFIANYNIDDDDNGSSNGNNNNIVDAGETIELNLTLENQGLTEGHSVTATLSLDPEYTSPDYINITQAQSSFGNISSLGQSVSTQPFIFSISPNIPDNCLLCKFILNIKNIGNVGNFNEDFYLEIHTAEPKLILNSIYTQINDDNIIDPGDHVFVTFELFNDGTGLATDLNGVLSSTSPYIDTIEISNQAFGDIIPLTSVSNSNPFEFDVKNLYNGNTIKMCLTETDKFGKEWTIPVDFDKPSVINNLGFTSTTNDISIYWNPNIQAQGYNVYRSNMEEGGYEKLNSKIITGCTKYTDSDLPELTRYYYKVSAISHSCVEGEKSQYLKAWTTLPYYHYWPNKLINVDNFGGRTEGSPMTADFNADGNKEIYFTTLSGDNTKGGIFGFHHDGKEIYDIDNDTTTYSGFYKFISASSNATPAIGDINNDNILEIITTTNKGDTTNEGDEGDRRKIFVHSTVDNDLDGKPDTLWSHRIGSPDYKGAVLADVDYNDTLEIISKGIWGSPLYLFNYDETNYNGWPKNIGKANGYGMPVAANIDNLGNKELIFGFNNSIDDLGNILFDAGIYIFNDDGTPFLEGNANGLFYKNSSMTTLFDRMDSPVSIADINNDGYDEIICVSGRYCSTKSKAKVFILNRFAETIPGWGYDSHIIDITGFYEDKSLWLPATSIGDIDQDGSLDIAIAEKGYIYAWDKNGNNLNSHFPIHVPGLEAKFIAPLLADVDDDDDIEIIIASNKSLNCAIHAYNIDGTKVLGWPLKLEGLFSTPCIEDINNDGKNEIIATSGNEVYVWETEGDADKIEWGKYRHDRYNSGVYGDFCPYTDNAIVINEDEDWNTNKILKSDLIIDQNATLTIHGNVALPNEGKIIVSPGAKLILDSATLTNACKGLWRGIQVWGNSNETQYEINGVCNQGKIILKNGAVIENAYNAITLWEPDNWSSTGGIVFAKDATFKNNRRAVEFMNYQNHNPITGELSGNLSYFNNCKFITDDNYINNEGDFNAFITMWKVTGITIKASTFENSQTNIHADKLGSGIISVDAKFCILPTCDVTPVPGSSCPEEYLNRTTFTGLYKGIEASNTSTNNSFYVNKAAFINNIHGIENNGVDFAGIIFFNFEIGGNSATPKTDCNDNINIGIYLNNCTGYCVEENNFWQSDLTTAGTFTYGIRTENTGKDYNLIYKNDFNGLYIANYSLGDNNHHFYPAYGLKYECNTNQDNIYDFYVDVDKGISSYQGSPDKPAGNIFSLNANNPASDFNNKGAYLVDYYYNPDNSNENPISIYRLNKISAAGENSCRSHFNNDTWYLTHDEKQEYEQSFFNNLQSYDSVNTIYESLKDGGNTTDLLTEIDACTPDNIQILRTYLLNKSPFLSEEVLKRLADKTNVVSHSILYEILSANPDELKNVELLEYLEGTSNPLPNDSIDLLKAYAYQTTYKTTLLSQMSEYTGEKTFAANMLIRDMLNDSIMNKSDSIRIWLDNKQNLESDYIIIDSWLNEGNTTEASTLLNTIPQSYNLTDEQLTGYNMFKDLKTIQINLINDDKTIFELDSLQLDRIVQIADSIECKASMQAKNILKFAYGYNYDECLELPNAGGYKSSAAVLPQNTNVDYKSFITAFPNPAKNSVTFNYNLPETTNNAFIIITKITGNSLRKIKLTESNGKVIFNTKNICPGVYLFYIKYDNKISKTKKLIIMK